MEIRRQVDNLMREELDLLKAVRQNIQNYFPLLWYTGCWEGQGKEGENKQEEEEGEERQQEGKEEEGQRPDARQDHGVSVRGVGHEQRD